MDTNSAPRWGRGVAWTVVAGWVVVACLSGWGGGALADRMVDDDRAFLPGDGTAADFDALRHRLIPPAERWDTATVVLTAAGGLSDGDVERLVALGNRLAADDDLEVAQVEAPARAPDGELALLDVRLRPAEDQAPAVAAIREAARDELDGEGREVLVTGGAAADADLGSGDVDLRLLLVSVVVVAAILAAAYRSLLLWLLPVTVGVTAVLVSHGLSALLAVTGFAVTDLAASIATVVVFGVSTDYALLLLNRLRRPAPDRDLRTAVPPDRRILVAAAVREVRTPVVVSAVIIALVVLTLVVSPVPGMRALGPVLAVGVVTAAAVSLTLLPALLVVVGVRVRTGAGAARQGARWSRVAGVVVRRPAAAVAAAAVILGAATLGGVAWSSSADPLGQIPDSAESKQGAERLREHLGAGVGTVVDVALTGDDADAQRLADRVAPLGAVRVDEHAEVRDGHALLGFRLQPAPYTAAWSRDLDRFTAAVRDVDPGALVGGTAVEAQERNDAAARQLWLVGPVLLVVLTLVLTGWLRSVVAAGVIVASSVLSCAAAWGLLSLLSPLVSGSDTVAAEVLLFGFLFLVAFGIDYVVFLVDGIRGAPGRSVADRVAHGLAATGPVITAAGAVLAATFGTLLLLPEANVRQVGLLVGAGVVVDTLVVRVLFVPAMLVLCRRYAARGIRPRVAPPGSADVGVVGGGGEREVQETVAG